MPTIADRLASDIVDKCDRNMSTPDGRMLVAIAGIPGAGKTTFASQLCHAVNAAWATRDSIAPSAAAPDEIAVVVGMDGFHLSRAQLDLFDDPDEAHRRRGAHWTFDAERFVRFVSTVQTRQRRIAYPTFDHAEKDAIEDGGYIEPWHRIVIFEGLYLALDIPPWNQLCFHRTLLLACKMSVARERLMQRHVASGVAASRAAAAARVDGSDMENARLICTHAVPGAEEIGVKLYSD